MELTLSRQDLIQVSPLGRKTMRLLPPLKKQRQQQVAVGDHSGSLLVFGMRKDTVEHVFKSPEVKKAEVGRVEVRYDSGEGSVFFASGQTVHAYTRKGKEFLRFNAPKLTEPIRSMCISNNEIHIGGEYTYNRYIDCKESGFMLANDRINDIACDNFSNKPTPDAAFACQDRFIRVVHTDVGEKGGGSEKGGGYSTGETEQLFEVAVDGPASVVERFSYADPTSAGVREQSGFGDSAAGLLEGAAARRDSKHKHLLYGTENGLVGQLVVDEGVFKRGWLIDPNLENRRGKSGAVQCMCASDLTKDGTKDLIVGRADGLAEVWSFDLGEQPSLVFERSLQESITSVECGLVSNAAYEEVIVATYAGKLISFSSEPASMQLSEGGAAVPGAIAAREKPTEKKKEKISSLMAELDKLRDKVAQERERFSRMSEALIAADVQFKLNDHFSLSAENACYQLSLELSVPLESILLQSDVPIELLEADSNVAILSRVDAGGPGLLATYRCQEVTNRLELRVRTSEGRYGALQVYVWPRISPKSCCSATYPIKPLSLHTRVLEAVDEAALPLMNSLQISGGFGLAEVHSWVSTCLPEVPVRLQHDEASFTFRNTFLGTLLVCTYKKGDARFQSDSLTTLAILKEVLTKEATARKIHIQISVEPRDETVEALLRRIDPLLQYQLSLSNKMKLVDSLKEVRMQEDDISFLAPEYLEILETEEQIKKELKEQPGRLQFLHGIITDLFVDKLKFRGQAVAQEPAREELNRLLRDYSLESMLNFFGVNPAASAPGMDPGQFHR